jgi:hypothetical protein
MAAETMADQQVVAAGGDKTPIGLEREGQHISPMYGPFGGAAAGAGEVVDADLTVLPDRHQGPPVVAEGHFAR